MGARTLTRLFDELCVAGRTIASAGAPQPPARKRTGCRPIPARDSSSSFASTAPRSRSSTRPGDPPRSSQSERTSRAARAHITAEMRGRQGVADVQNARADRLSATRRSGAGVRSGRRERRLPRDEPSRSDRQVRSAPASPRHRPEELRSSPACTRDNQARERRCGVLEAQNHQADRQPRSPRAHQARDRAVARTTSESSGSDQQDPQSPPRTLLPSARLSASESRSPHRPSLEGLASPCPARRRVARALVLAS